LLAVLFATLCRFLADLERLFKLKLHVAMSRLRHFQLFYGMHFLALKPLKLFHGHLELLLVLIGLLFLFFFDLFLQLIKARVLFFLDQTLDFLLSNHLRLLDLLMLDSFTRDASLLQGAQLLLFGCERLVQHLRQLVFPGAFEGLFSSPSLFLDSDHVVALLIVSLFVELLHKLHFFFGALLSDGDFLSEATRLINLPLHLGLFRVEQLDTARQHSCVLLRVFFGLHELPVHHFSGSAGANGRLGAHNGQVSVD